MRWHLWIMILTTSLMIHFPCSADSHQKEEPQKEEDQKEDPEPTPKPPETPELSQMLEQFAKGAPNSKERTDLVKAYVDSFKDLPSDERQKAVEDFFKTTSMLNDRDDFFEAIKDLPEETKLDIEKGVLKLAPDRNLRLLRFLSKDAQVKGLERAVEQTKQDPRLIGQLANVAAMLNFNFSQPDLNRFVLAEKQYDRELLRQFSKNNPEGVKQLLKVFKESEITGGDAFSSIAEAMEKSDIPLHLEQQKELREYVEKGPLSPRNRDLAFKALKGVAPQIAQELLDELSQSNDPKDLVLAAGFVGDENPKSDELLTKALKTANPETLQLIREKFVFAPNLEGFSPERLKLLAEWDLKGGVSGIYKSSIKELFSQGVNAGDILPILKLGLEKSPTETLLALDNLPAEDAKRFENLSPLVMSAYLESLDRLSITGHRIDGLGVSFLSHFPKIIDSHAAALKEKVENYQGEGVLKLLGATQNPKYLDTYLSHVNDSQELKSFAASEALGTLLSVNPSLANSSVMEKLREVLEAKDERDQARLHLRQHLPETLMLQLDQQIMGGQERDPERAAAVLRKTTESALEILKKEGVGLMGAGQRGLALEFLIRSGHKEAPQLVGDYLKTAFSKGYIHNVNSIQGVIRAAQQAGISIDPEVLSKAQIRLEREASRLWNAGNPEMQKNGNSNLIPFGGAAYITSATDPSQLNETQKGILETLQKMRGQPVPYFFSTADEPKETGALLDKAPTSGRAVTTGLALYLTAPSDKKPEAARELLGAARTFLQHFSQTHEIPRASDRTHDRTPGSQQMAAYYGFANDPNAMVALMTLSKEPSLSPGERQEAARMALQLQTRLLTLTEKDGSVHRRESESFTNENRVYQILTGLSIIQGPNNY